MSKDRLEEIKSELKRSNNVGGIGNPGAEQMILDLHEIGRFEWLVKYAEEQSQRVQELERDNKQLKGNLSVYQGYYKSTLKHNKKLIEQNKCYREAIEKAREYLKRVPVGSHGVNKAYEIMIKAMEEEE